MKKERQNRILYIFLSYKSINKYILKNHLDISFKTLERDISDLNDFLKPMEGYISKINESYVLKNVNTNLILDFLKLNNEFLLISERMIFIILEIYKNKSVLQWHLIEDLEISKNILVEDLKLLKIILKKYDLELTVEKKGISITPLEIINLIPLISDIVVDHILSKKVLSLIQYGSLKNLFSEYVFKKLVRYFKLDNFIIIYNYLIELIIDKKNLSEINIIIIAIKITFYLNHPNNLNINFTDITTFEKSLKNIYMSNTDSKLLNSLYLKDETNFNIFQCVDEIKINFEKLFNHKILFDDYILERLSKHLIANIFIEKVDSLIIEEYKENLFKYKNSYFEIYSLILNSINKYFLNKNQNIALTYELFIHIIIWLNIEFSNMNLKLLAVCVGGMGQSFMIKSYLKSLYKNADIETSSLSLVNKKIFEKYDLIVSTIDVEKIKVKNLIQVSVMLLLNNKNELTFLINYKIYESLIGKNKFTKIFSSENILVNQESKNKNDAIILCGKFLKKLGYINDEYIYSMLEREEHSSTYIGNYIAIPHGINSNGVLNDGIILIHFKNPILFNNKPVHFLITIASKNNSHYEIFSEMTNKLLEIDFVEELLKNPSKERIFKEFDI